MLLGHRLGVKRQIDMKQSSPSMRAAVIQNILSLTSGAALSQALLAASMLLTARGLGASKFGQYASCFSTAGLGAVIFNLGLDNWLLWNGARRPGEIEKLLGGALAIEILLGIPWIGLLFVILPCLNSYAFPANLVLLSAIATWVEGLLMLSLSTFKALLRNQITVLLLIGSRGALLLITLLLFLFDSRQPTTYAWARLSVNVLSLLAVLHLIPLAPRSVSAAMLKQIGGETLPFAFSDLLTSIYTQADKTITAVFLGDKAVGIYTPAASLVSALFVIPNAWYAVMVPTFVNISTKGGSIRRAIGLTLTSFAIVGIALWLSTWYAAENLMVPLLGNSFHESKLLLKILSPILFLKSCSFAAVAILVAAGWQDRRIYIQAISAIVNVALNLAIIRSSGVVGVATIYVLSEGILMLGYLGLVALWAQQIGRSSAYP